MAKKPAAAESKKLLAINDGVVEALQEVRNDNSSTNWALLCYGADNKSVSLEGKGTGGHSELLAKFVPEKIQYALLRVNDAVDGHTTVKFVFIQWVGEKVKATVRALTATHKGEITELIGSHHVSLYGSNSSEVSEGTIMASVTKASGTSNKVLGDDNRTAAPTASAGTGATKREHGAAGSGAFDVAPDVEAAVKNIRKDTFADDWALLSYKGNTNTLELAGHGSGGVDALSKLLNASSIAYGLVRVNEKIDESNTTKFVRITWVGESVPATRKATVTTHKSNVSSLLGPAQVDVYASSPSEVSSALIIEKVKSAAGTADRVLGEVVKKEPVPHTGGKAPAVAASPKAATKKETSAPAAASAAAPVESKPFRGNANSGTKTAAGPGTPETKQVAFEKEDESRAALAEVRKDGSASDWVLLGYAGQTSTLQLLGTGGGGLAALRAKIDGNNAYYGLLRTTEKIDDSVTTKFVFIICIGDAVKGVRKARIATHKGEVTGFFGQYHVDVTVANAGELTDELVRATVQKAAGTKNNIL